MHRKIQIGSAVLLLFAPVATMMFVVHEYRRGRDVSSLLYTRSVKKRDIVDAARAMHLLRRMTLGFAERIMF
jgi:hypothetical protein